jgi:hypothetical protein
MTFCTQRAVKMVPPSRMKGKVIKLGMRYEDEGVNVICDEGLATGSLVITDD